MRAWAARVRKWWLRRRVMWIQWRESRRFYRAHGCVVSCVPNTPENRRTKAEDMLVGTGQPGRDRRRALEDRDRNLNSDPDEISPQGPRVSPPIGSCVRLEDQDSR